MKTLYARLETSGPVHGETYLVLYESLADMDPAHGCSMHALAISQLDLTQLIKAGAEIEVIC